VQISTTALTLPEVSDPTYYSARELDSYPRPVAPLNFGHTAGTTPDGVPGRAQLLLQINEHGTVDRVSIVETALPGDLEDELRAMLAATRFVPARKDGRPVKSRVLLRIDFARAGEEQGPQIPKNPGRW